MQIEPDREPINSADDSVDEETLLRIFNEAWDSLSEEEWQEERAERELLLGGWIGSGN